MCEIFMQSCPKFFFSPPFFFKYYFFFSPPPSSSLPIDSTFFSINYHAQEVFQGEEQPSG